MDCASIRGHNRRMNFWTVVLAVVLGNAISVALSIVLASFGPDEDENEQK